MIQINNLKRDIERIEGRYDAENDTIPGAPIVTWTDIQLLELIKELTRMVGVLQKQITEI